jgi:hypothetical protein
MTEHRRSYLFFCILRLNYSQIQVVWCRVSPSELLLTLEGELGWNEAHWKATRRQICMPDDAGTMEEPMSYSQTTISKDEIARRAYEIWEARGCPPGDGSDDWRTAEDELTATRVRRNGSTQQRMQSWWERVRDKFVGNF